MPEHKDHDQVAKVDIGIRIHREVGNDQVVLFGREEMRHGSFYFGIFQARSDVFADYSSHGEKVKELVHTPNPGLLRMHGGTAKSATKSTSIA